MWWVRRPSPSGPARQHHRRHQTRGQSQRGQGDDRANIKVGMKCSVSMPPDAKDDIEAVEVVCE